MYSSSLSHRLHTGVNVEAVYSLSPVVTELESRELAYRIAGREDSGIYTSLYIATLRYSLGSSILEVISLKSLNDFDPLHNGSSRSLICVIS